MKLLWLIGIEGSGHHMLRDVLRGILASREVIDKGAYYPLWLQRWDGEQEPLPAKVVSNVLGDILREYQSSGCTHIYEDTSFPFGPTEAQFTQFISGGENRGSRRRPNISDMIQLMEEMVELKILVMYRRPLATVNSVLRRGFSNNPEFECQLAEEIHLYLAEELNRLAPGSYRSCHFDDFLHSPSKYVVPLAEWWDLPPDLIREGLDRIRKPTAVHEIPPERRKLFERYFTEERVAQWLGPYQQNPLISL